MRIGRRRILVESNSLIHKMKRVPVSCIEEDCKKWIRNTGAGGKNTKSDQREI